MSFSWLPIRPVRWAFGSVHVLKQHIYNVRANSSLSFFGKLGHGGGGSRERMVNMWMGNVCVAGSRGGTRKQLDTVLLEPHVRVGKAVFKDRCINLLESLAGTTMFFVLTLLKCSSLRPELGRSARRERQRETWEWGGGRRGGEGGGTWKHGREMNCLIPSIFHEGSMSIGARRSFCDV